MGFVNVWEGRTVNYSNTGSAISKGAWVALAFQCGPASDDIAATTGTGAVAVAGNYKVTKVTGTAWTLGQRLYYNGTAVTPTVALGAYFVGFAAQAAASAATEGIVALAPYSAEGGRVVAANAAAATALLPADLTSGTLSVSVANTAAVTVTLPDVTSELVPPASIVTVHKNSADAEAVTVAGFSGQTIVGATGTIDADNDRVTLMETEGVFSVVANTIA